MGLTQRLEDCVDYESKPEMTKQEVKKDQQDSLILVKIVIQPNFVFYPFNFLCRITTLLLR